MDNTTIQQLCDLIYTIIREDWKKIRSVSKIKVISTDFVMKPDE